MLFSRYHNHTHYPLSVRTSPDKSRVCVCVDKDFEIVQVPQSGAVKVQNPLNNDNVGAHDDIIGLWESAVLSLSLLLLRFTMCCVTLHHCYSSPADRPHAPGVCHKVIHGNLHGFALTELLHRGLEQFIIECIYVCERV